MSTDPYSTAPEVPQKKRDWKFIILSSLGGLVLLFLIALLVALFFYWKTFHASKYDPVELSEKEEVVLEEKLNAFEEGSVIDVSADLENSVEFPTEQVVPPTPEIREGVEVVEAEVETHAEDPGTVEEYVTDEDERSAEERRHITLTEREINSMFHNNTELGDRFYIDLKPNTLKAGAVIPVDEDFPFLGGKTVKAKVSLAAMLDENGRLAVYIRDVSAWGIPIPNAWIADVKGKNLVSEDGGRKHPGLSRFADGIKFFEIKDGEIEIILNE